MAILFERILEHSLSATFLIMAVLLIRALLNKTSHRIILFLWGIVFLRLIMPFSIKSDMSLVPSFNNTITIHAENPTKSIEEKNDQNPIAEDEEMDHVMITKSNKPWIRVAMVVWLMGVCFMVFWGMIGYVRLYGKLSESIKGDDNNWYCDHINTALVFGVLRPKIYLPSNILEDDKKYVVAHENAHIRHGDHLWKTMGYLLLSLYWFNPFTWIAWFLFDQDIERACDERVIKQIGAEEKKAYANALVNCSVYKQAVISFPLAFGETGIRKRIENIMSHRKIPFWGMIMTVVLLVVLIICFMTDPGLDFSIDTEHAEKIIIQVNGGEKLEITDHDQMEQMLSLNNSISVKKEKLYLDYQNWNYMIQVSDNGGGRREFYLNVSDVLRKGLRFYEINGGAELCQYLNHLFFWEEIGRGLGGEIKNKYKDISFDPGTTTCLTYEEQIEAVILILHRFEKWKNCELHNIRYDESAEEDIVEWINARSKKKGWDANFVKGAVFLSDFKTPSDAEEWSSFNADFEYENWKWTLGLTKEGEWQLIDAGY